MPRLTFESGISTLARSTRTALRMRVNMSAIGSVIMVLWFPLPTRLLHTGDHAVVGQLAEADTADAKFAVHSARTAAQFAARLSPRRKLRLTAGFRDFRFTCH